MNNLKELCIFILTIMYISIIFSIGIWEMTKITNYEYNEFIMATEIDAYNFTFFSSIINIINSLYLLWIMINKNYNKISLSVIMIINVCVCIWSILLYINIELYHDFISVIITQFIITLIELSIISLLSLIIFSLYLYNCNKAYVSEHIIINDYILL